MKRMLLLLLLLATPGWAQNGDFVRLRLPGGTGSPGGSMADPGCDGIMVRTAENVSICRSLTSAAGTLAFLNADGVAGNIVADVDSSIYGQFAAGTNSAPSTCVQGDIYYETDTGIATMCPSTDSPVTIANLTTGTADPPATCSPGAFYYETDVFELSFCRGSNTWEYVITQNAQTDDALVVGNGTGFSLKVVPDCDDSAGQHLNYDNTTNAFTCGTSGGGAFDPSTTIQFYEEFLGGGSAGGAAAVGSNAWSTSALSTGTAAADPGTAANPGTFLLKSHATNDNSGNQVIASPSATLIGPVWQARDWTMDAVVVMGSAVEADSAFWFGLTNAGAGFLTADSGVWIRRDTDLGDTAFVFQLCDATGAAGCQDANDGADSETSLSTITPSNSTAYRFRIRRVTAGVGGNPTIYMRVNDEAEKTFCSATCDDTIGDLPTGDLRPQIAFVTRTTTGVKQVGVDYLSFTVTGLDRY